MKLNTRQKAFVLKTLKLNLGSDSTVKKDDIIQLAEGLGLQFKKNIAKVDLIELIVNSGFEKHLYQSFAELIAVPFWELNKEYGISYKEISDLEQLGVIKALERKGSRDVTLYPISVLRFKDGELSKFWNDKYQTDFHRTRVEVNNVEEFQKLVDELSKAFEVENVSKPYKQRDYGGYYCYLSIRPLQSPVTNENYKNEENARLKAEIGVLQAEIEQLKEALELKSQKHAGGRPPKLTDADKELIKMYRLQGKTINELATLFKCSVGTVHKLVNES